MNKMLLKRIEEIFFEKLQYSTGWRRDEIMIYLTYKEAVSEAILELIK